MKIWKFLNINMLGAGMTWFQSFSSFPVLKLEVPDRSNEAIEVHVKRFD